MSWVAVAIGGSAILGAGAGMMGSASSNRAGRQARDFYGNQTGAGANRLGSAFFGSGPNSDYRSMYDNGVDPAGQAAAADRFNRANGGSLLDQQRNVGAQGYTGGQNLTARFDQGMGGINGQAQGNLASMRSLYGQNTAGLDRMGQQGQSMAANYGAGANSLIDEQSARDLKGANQTSLAQMNSTGLGNSTLSSNAMAGNAENIGRGARQQKLGVRQQTTQMGLGALGQRMGMGAERAAQTEQGVSGMMNQNVNRSFEANRQRTGLEQGNLERNLGLMQQPINAQMQVQQSSAMNPWLGQGTSQYYPGKSGAGSALGTAGNGLATYGGMAMFNPYGAGAPRAGLGGNGMTDPFAGGQMANSQYNWNG